MLGVVEGAEVDDDLVAVLVGVDVVEGEARHRSRTAPVASPRRAVEEREARAALGLPAVVLDVGAAAESASASGLTTNGNSASTSQRSVSPKECM